MTGEENEGEIQSLWRKRKNEGEKDDDIRGGKDYVFYIYFKKETELKKSDAEEA